MNKVKQLATDVNSSADAREQIIKYLQRPQSDHIENFFIFRT